MGVTPIANAHDVDTVSIAEALRTLADGIESGEALLIDVDSGRVAEAEDPIQFSLSTTFYAKIDSETLETFNDKVITT